MFNRFGTIDFIKKTSSGDYDKEDVERYISELMSDFSRIKSVMQRNVDEARAEKELAEQENEQLKNNPDIGFNKSREPDSRVREVEDKLEEMHRLQDQLKRVESERSELSARLGEIEEKNIRNEEDLKSVLAEKKEIEEKNHSLQSAYEEALERIESLTQEKDDAVLSENEAREQILEQIRQNDDLTSELNNLRSINDRLSQEIDSGFDAAGFIGDDEPFDGADFAADGEEAAEAGGEEVVSDAFKKEFGNELVTDSGLELFRMLRGLLQDDRREENGVKVTKSWEEETEEIVPGAFPFEPSITKKVHTRSEVSVEYTAGRSKTF